MTPSPLDGSTPGGLRLRASLRRALAGEPVRIGTGNAAKGEAVRRALWRFAAEWTVPTTPKTPELVPVEVDSGVPEQPIGPDQIAAGARNRARRAFASGEACLAVGLEDGLLTLPGSSEEGAPEFFNLGCAWIFDGEVDGVGWSAGFRYPDGCLDRAVQEQAPIGELFDALWADRRGADPERASGPGIGNIGRLTAGHLGRAEYGEQAVVCALIRFLHEDLYD